MPTHRLPHTFPLLGCTLLLAAMLTLCSTGRLQAQPEVRRSGEYTTEGREFWIIFQKNFRDWMVDDRTGGLRRADPLQLELFITSSGNARGVIEIRGIGFRQEFIVQAGRVLNVPIDTAAQFRSAETVEDMGVHITSDEPIAVYALNRRFQTTDTYLAHPINVLGTVYRVMGYKPLQKELVSQAAVVATEDNTVVTFTPTVETSGPGTAGAAGHAANTPFTVQLNKGQAYQIMPRWKPGMRSDLTGTLISADKPIAVFSGHNCAYVPDADVKACNLLVEQVPPVRSWGRQFFVGALAARTSSVLRVLASEDSTQVFENNLPVANLKAGEFYENTNLRENTMITATRPVLVAQLSKGFDNGDNVGDPMMIAVAPTEQFLSAYRFATPVRGSWKHYINLVALTASLDSLRLDSMPINRALFRPIGLSLYSIAQVEVRYGTHVITNSSPFGLYSYGFGYDEAAYDAYGNGGGQSMEQVIVRDDKTPPFLTAVWTRVPRDPRGQINAVAHDDRVDDQGLMDITVLEQENLEVSVPRFATGAPQVPLPVRPITERASGSARLQLRDRAGNTSIQTICAQYDPAGDTLVVRVLTAGETCEFAGTFQIGPMLGYAILDNNVSIPITAEGTAATIALKGNGGVPTYNVGVSVEQPLRGNFALAGRLNFTLMNATPTGYDSTRVATDNSRLVEEYRLQRRAVNVSIAPGLQYYMFGRKLYLLGLLNVGLPLYRSETLTRTILSPSNHIYQNGTGEETLAEGSVSGGSGILVTPELALGVGSDLRSGWRVFMELGMGHSITSVSSDHDWSVGYGFARFGARVKF